MFIKRPFLERNFGSTEYLQVGSTVFEIVEGDFIWTQE
jgi:hypothetical protein